MSEALTGKIAHDRFAQRAAEVAEGESCSISTTPTPSRHWQIVLSVLLGITMQHSSQLCRRFRDQHALEVVTVEAESHTDTCCY